jgi:hypothetical protein
MDDTQNQQLEQLNQDIASAVNEVDQALESQEEPRQIAAGQHVEALAARWRQISATLAPADLMMAERGVGRRLTDLRRAAAALSRRDSGREVALATDAGFVPFLERRTPPKSIVPQRGAPASKLSVGAEVESWCGKCKEMTTHNIVAMIGDTAKQVICKICNSRHDFRDEPPARHRTAVRNAAAAAAAAAASANGAGYDAGGRRVEDRELLKRQEAKKALQTELANAVDPRPFDPKGRYKSGEIIVHPEHGRGKIENVLRGSLLVRFLEGLRPLDLA